MSHDVIGLNQASSTQDRASSAAGSPASSSAPKHTPIWNPESQNWSLPPPPRPRIIPGQRGTNQGRTPQRARSSPAGPLGSAATTMHGSTPIEPQSLAQSSSRPAGMHQRHDSAYTVFGVNPPSSGGHGRLPEPTRDQGISQPGYSVSTRSTYTLADHVPASSEDYLLIPNSGSQPPSIGSYGGPGSGNLTVQRTFPSGDNLHTHAPTTSFGMRPPSVDDLGRRSEETGDQSQLRSEDMTLQSNFTPRG